MTTPHMSTFLIRFVVRIKKIYYECILQLIEKSKSIPLLYEADARDTLVLYFRNCAYVVEDEENGGEAEAHISGRKTEMENAGAI